MVDSTGTAFPHSTPAAERRIVRMEVALHFHVILVEARSMIPHVFGKKAFATPPVAYRHSFDTPAVGPTSPIPRIVESTLSSIRMTNQAGHKLLGPSLSACTSPVTLRVVHLPAGQDPNSFFLAGSQSATISSVAWRRLSPTTFQLILRESPSASPYRLLDGQGRELAWANAFLDAQRLRQVSSAPRAYGYDLLHLARWVPTSMFTH